MIAFKPDNRLPVQYPRHLVSASISVTLAPSGNPFELG
jgi:hypothetical protein